MCFPYCVLIGDLHKKIPTPPPSLSLCGHSSLAVRRCWQSHNVAWRNAETLAPSSIFQKKHQSAESLGWAPPLPSPLSTHLVSDGCVNMGRGFSFILRHRRESLNCSSRAVCNSQAVLLTLLRRKKHTQKKAAQAWQDVHIPHQDDLLSQSG